jgi:hypothetical protein
LGQREQHFLGLETLFVAFGETQSLFRALDTSN